MAKITINHPESHEKLTARLFWKLTTDEGYNDAGNVRDYNHSTTRSLVTRNKGTRGFRPVNAEAVDINHESYTFTLDERNAEQERFIGIANNLTDSTQAQSEGETATIENVGQGKWFEIGSYNIENVAISGTVSGSLDEGIDYEVDYENGRIKPITGGSVSSGETLTLTFDQPSLTIQRVQTQQKPLFRCDFIIEEHNQFNRMFLRRMAFTGYMNLTEFPTHTGEFASYKSKVTPDGPVTIFKRTDTVIAVDDIYFSSSSSSSSNSSSSTSSQSSSSSTSSSSTEASYTSSSSSESSYSSSSSTVGQTTSSSESSSSSTEASETSSSSSDSTTSSSSSTEASETSSTSSDSSNSSSSSTVGQETSSSSSSTFAQETSSSSSSTENSSSSSSSTEAMSSSSAGV